MSRLQHVHFERGATPMFDIMLGVTLLLTHLYTRVTQIKHAT